MTNYEKALVSVRQEVLRTLQQASKDVEKYQQAKAGIQYARKLLAVYEPNRVFVPFTQEEKLLDEWYTASDSMKAEKLRACKDLLK